MQAAGPGPSAEPAAAAGASAVSAAAQFLAIGIPRQPQQPGEEPGVGGGPQQEQQRLAVQLYSALLQVRQACLALVLLCWATRFQAPFLGPSLAELGGWVRGHSITAACAAGAIDVGSKRCSTMLLCVCRPPLLASSFPMGLFGLPSGGRWRMLFACPFSV
jgi:hypothetical protein